MNLNSPSVKRRSDVIEYKPKRQGYGIVIAFSRQFGSGGRGILLHLGRWRYIGRDARHSGGSLDATRRVVGVIVGDNEEARMENRVEIRAGHFDGNSAGNYARRGLNLHY